MCVIACSSITNCSLKVSGVVVDSVTNSPVQVCRTVIDILVSESFDLEEIVFRFIERHVILEREEEGRGFVL